jgi:apolipoprotein N-acyltransferase
MMNLPYSDFTRGETVQAPLTARGHSIAASVCYEATYGATLARDAAASALLVNVSNDAWFGDTIAPHQHLQIVRMRALEAGRWMLRATNTGITAVIDPRGQVTATLPQFETGVLRAEVVPQSGATPYARARDWPVLALLAGLLGLGAWRRFGYP